MCLFTRMDHDELKDDKEINPERLVFHYSLDLALEKFLTEIYPHQFSK